MKKQMLLNMSKVNLSENKKFTNEIYITYRTNVYTNIYKICSEIYKIYIEIYKIHSKIYIFIFRHETVQQKKHSIKLKQKFKISKRKLNKKKTNNKANNNEPGPWGRETSVSNKCPCGFICTLYCIATEKYIYLRWSNYRKTPH